MGDLFHLFIYGLLFLTLYFQVFMLVTFLEERRNSKRAPAKKNPEAELPDVSIIVPAYNEEGTIAGTIHSLLRLDYPKEKLKILVIEDGSTDTTLARLSEFEGNPQITIIAKENGGKFTALNLGISQVTTELVGCLDADSFVAPDALRHIVSRFHNPEVMAVTPLIQVHNSNNIIERIQNIEYILSALIRKVFGSLNALYVTPGPFSIYRRSVFEKIGLYKHAHNTEDLEMALRMQMNHLRIENAEKAVVYTVTPRTIHGLYRQRVRWIYGFLANARDYSHLLFRRAYGNLGVFSLPFAVISIFTGIFFAANVFATFGIRFYNKYLELQTVGFSWNGFTFDWFFVKTDPQALLKYAVITFLILMIISGITLVRVKRWRGVILDGVFFLAFYGILAPIWLLRAVYGAARMKGISWR